MQAWEASRSLTFRRQGSAEQGLEAMGLVSGMLGGMGLPARDTELVQILDAALAGAALRAGDWLACRVGCTQCCYGAFAINALDAARLQTGMETLRHQTPALTAALERRARNWIEEH